MRMIKDNIKFIIWLFEEYEDKTKNIVLKCVSNICYLFSTLFLNHHHNV